MLCLHVTLPRVVVSPEKLPPICCDSPSGVGAELPRTMKLRKRASQTLDESLLKSIWNRSLSQGTTRCQVGLGFRRDVSVWENLVLLTLGAFYMFVEIRTHPFLGLWSGIWGTVTNANKERKVSSWQLLLHTIRTNDTRVPATSKTGTEIDSRKPEGGRRERKRYLLAGPELNNNRFVVLAASGVGTMVSRSLLMVQWKFPAILDICMCVSYVYMLEYRFWQRMHD